MSTIDNAKKAMGWTDPTARAGCGNCDRVDIEQAFGGTSYRCRKGFFYTKRFALCDQYIPLKLTGGAPT